MHLAVVLQGVAVLQCVAVCCRVLQGVAVCCRVLQGVAVCCSVLQCVAVCCSVLQHTMLAYTRGNSHMHTKLISSLRFTTLRVCPPLPHDPLLHKLFPDTRSAPQPPHPSPHCDYYIHLSVSCILQSTFYNPVCVCVCTSVSMCICV